MSYPGASEHGGENLAGTELSIYDASAPNVTDYDFRQMVIDPQAQILSEERRRRAMSFELAHSAVAQWEATFGRAPTFHRTYVDPDGLPIERRAVVQIFSFPGGGQPYPADGKRRRTRPAR